MLLSRLPPMMPNAVPMEMPMVSQYCDCFFFPSFMPQNYVSRHATTSAARRRSILIRFSSIAAVVRAERLGGRAHAGRQVQDGAVGRREDDARHFHPRIPLNAW